MQEKQNTIQILYTANLGGNIHRLPRLYSIIKGLRQEGLQTTLVDLGGTCAPDAWHCAATDGRSMLIVLDGMGYSAANVEGLSPISKQKLEENLTMALIDGTQTHVEEDVLCTLVKSPGDGHLCVSLLPAEFTGITDGFALYLAPPQPDQLGEVIVHHDGSAYSIETTVLHTVSDTTPPDATIAGVVDFVLDEARYFQKRRAEKVTPAHRAVMERSAALLDHELDVLRVLFSEHLASAPIETEDWNTVKQLGFLISHAANELAERIVFVDHGVRFERHNRVIYQAPPFDRPMEDVRRVCRWLVLADEVLNASFQVSQHDDVLSLTFHSHPSDTNNK